MLKVIDENNLETLLDLGCGDAGKSIFFAENGMMVTGLDEFEGHGSEATLEEIQNKITDLGFGGKIEIIKMDAIDINKLSQTFDVVFAQNSLHHIFEYPISRSIKVEKFFQKLNGRITPQGYFYITEINQWDLWDFLSKIIPGNWHKSSDLFRTINPVNFSSKTPLKVWVKHLQNS